MTQANLIPVICDRTKPPPATADADCIAIETATERRFLCKSARKEKLLPATEWICASLARSCGILVADWTIVQVAGSAENLFGSVWEGGSKDAMHALPAVTNRKLFSEALALDYTIHNVDRHFGNYLYLELAGDIVVKLIDSSRALMFHGWPLPSLPMSGGENTVQCAAMWQRHHPFEPHHALAITQRLASLPDSWMSTTISGMPAEWLDPTATMELCDWWAAKRSIRVAAVEGLLS